LSPEGLYSETIDFPPVLIDSGTVVIDEGASTLTVTTTASSNPAMIPIGYTYTGSYSFSPDFDTLTFNQNLGL